VTPKNVLMTAVAMGLAIPFLLSVPALRDGVEKIVVVGPLQMLGDTQGREAWYVLLSGALFPRPMLLVPWVSFSPPFDCLLLVQMQICTPFITTSVLPTNRQKDLTW